MMDMDDYGVVSLGETLDKKGPLSMMDLTWEASETFKDGEWNDYLQACFDHLVFKNKIIETEEGVYAIIDECRPKPPVELLDPNREYYCSNCFTIHRKLVFMKALKDDGAGIHMCPDCGGVGKMNWMAILATCDTYIHHYRKMKEQVKEEMELEDDE